MRDKPISASDVHVFAAKCLSMGVRQAAVLMATDRHPQLDGVSRDAQAQARGLGLTMFCGWPDLVRQPLFWSADPTPQAAVAAAGLIRERLITVEASPKAVESCTRWVRSAD